MTNELQARSPLSRARGVHEEWMQVTDSLRRIGNELNQILIDSMDESRAHNTRATEWETRHRDIVTENNAFRAHNEELKRLLELSKPDTRNVIESRDAAYRKLQHVQRVMRNLLMDMDLAPDFGDSPNEGASLLLQAEPEPKYKDIGASSSPSGQSHRNDKSSNSSGSGKTARPMSKGKERSSPKTPMTVPISSPALTSYSRSSRTGVSGGVVSDLSNQQRSSESNNSSEPSTDLSVHAARKSSGGVGDVWKLTSSRSPRSAEVIYPVDMQMFQEQLNLGEDTIYSLESLGQADEHCFPLQIVDNMAFTVHAYIVKNCPRDRVLHTFTFPVKRGVWYYIGAQKWDVKDIFEIWSTLGDRVSLRSLVRGSLTLIFVKAKEVVTGKLQRRCNRRLSQQEIAEMIQDGRLQQFCIEVSGRLLKDVSRAFAKTSLGYEGGNVAQ
ncbi:uncharacterized protein F5891DRAFT_999729 [Suillus fuscotomentosus]|uniref:Uncharacterized protein n=1 Tax=Suillus fuscotomentosus TaxID=1912939 RepID=A0AAD4EIW1_9AGAM|nr:uncharacterized protein F5891DRAFT_999729 [Suillus fuscotomentosus]KAG1906997.1 hypothetical protein F5891DRAFT_999729 [Suillus fuscotomentosus]